MEQDNNLTAASNNEPGGDGVRKLRLFFLVPLLLAILTIVAALVISNYSHRQQEIKLGIVKLRTSAAVLYEVSIQQNMRALHTVMDVLERDEDLHRALANKDRQVLLERSEPLFDNMKRNLGITHFYFTGTDRVNLLRVHQPLRYGDVISRTTTLNAERSGAMASGIELGPLGLLTLRLVSPWYDSRTHRLIGYVELGMEVDRVLENIHNLFGLEIYVLIQKEFLQRKSWEDGMRTLGRTPEWERFPNAVISIQGPHELAPELADLFSHTDFSATSFSRELLCGGHPCQAIVVPLSDVSGRKVAQMILLADTTQQEAEAHRAVVVGSAVSVVMGAVLFWLFFWLVGRVGRRIEHDEQLLLELARHDGLTGLYNHRTFYALLEDEIARAVRYQHPLSLLMLDIDHFKRVNDTYGHVAGDRILSGLAQIMREAARREDRACRYGGEEMTMILPETDQQAAMQAAERLRVAVEQAVFKSDSGQEIHITVSIGVSSLPEQFETLQDLVNGADAALYVAKAGGRNQVCSQGVGKKE